jgi:arylsulfatase A-like enzyme
MQRQTASTTFLRAHRRTNGAVWNITFIALLAASVASARGAAPATAPSGDKRPNVIFILADDLGYGDLGCYGQQRIKTPNIDRMAAEGLRFTDAYAGATVCAPSRCVLMTGLDGGHAAVRGNTQAAEKRAALHAEDVTIARVLKDAGYATGIVGKWGLGEPANNTQGMPRQQGFDYHFGYLRHGHAHNYYTDHLWRNGVKESLPNVISKNPAHNSNVASKKVVYSHDLFADEALRFVREHQEEPFFLYLAFTIPHANNEAGDQGMEVPDYGKYADLDWPAPEKGHAAMISRMDADVGRLLELVKKLGLDENTLVIFTSDNGPHREGGHDPDFNDSNGPLRGYKGGVTEGGIRVPLVARWPGRVPAGSTTDAPISFADMMPTLAAVGGGQAPPGINGADITATLYGQSQPELSERFLYWEFYKDGVVAQSSRLGEWKAVRNPKSGKIELYDLQSDVGESHNVAAEHPDLVEKFDKYFTGAARTDDPDWPMTPSASKQPNRAAVIQR